MKKISLLALTLSACLVAPAHAADAAVVPPQPAVMQPAAPVAAPAPATMETAAPAAKKPVRKAAAKKAPAKKAPKSKKKPAQ